MQYDEFIHRRQFDTEHGIGIHEEEFSMYPD
jgi:hypothetical protein